MKYIQIISWIVVSFIVSIVGHYLYLNLSGRNICGEGCESYYYGFFRFFIIFYSPLIGGFFGWKFFNSKSYKLLLFFPIYFVSMFIFAWYSSVYGRFMLPF